jgi:ribose 1,5-bisphosphokinase PhnN
MTTFAAALVLLIGVALIVAAARWIPMGREDPRDARRRLAEAARREAVRQEQDRHPVDRLDWTPYRRGRDRNPSRALWQVNP